MGIKTGTTNRKGKAVFKRLVRGKKYSAFVQRSGYTFTKSQKTFTIKKSTKSVSFICAKDEGEPVTPMTKPAAALIRVNGNDDDRYFDFSKGQNLLSSQDIRLGGIFFGNSFIGDINGLVVTSTAGTSWNDADAAPESGYGTSDQPNSVDLERNAVYFVKTKEGRYAKLLVRSISDLGELVIDWFYQSDGSRTFTPDTTAPEIASVTPAENSTDVAIAAEFKITFDEPIANTYVLSAQIEGGSKSLSFDFPTHDYAENSLILPLSTNLENDTLYTVTIKAPFYSPDDYYAEDLSGNKLILDKTWSFTTEPASSAFSGKILFVHYSNDEIWKMDAGGANETLIYSDPNGVFYQKISPDGNKFLYYDITTQTIYLLDVISETVTTVASGLGSIFGGSYDFSPDSSRIAYALSNGGINIYDIGAKTMASIPSLWATVLDWSNALGSEKIIFRNNTSANISEIDAVTKVVTETYSSSAWNPVYSPDGSKVALLIDDSNENDNSKLNVMNSDGSGLARITSGTGDEYYSVWSPTGDRIAFTRDNKLYVIGSDGTNEISLAPFSSKIKRQQDPFWSPDGSYIAYTAYIEDLYDNFYHDIYVVKADGTGSERAVTSQGG